MDFFSFPNKIPMKRLFYVLFTVFLFITFLAIAHAIPNPAATYCADQGYTLVTEDETTYCDFGDGQRCEEWAFINGECGAEYVVEMACREGGQPIGMSSCCEGLTMIDNYEVDENGECQLLIGGYSTCSDCGNSVCEEWENYCSCPEDCQAPNGSDFFMKVFDDVDQETDYWSAIHWMANNGVINGYGDGNFGPNDCVKRVELLKMVFEMLSIDETASTYDLFPDTSLNEWYAPYVRTARERGTVEGYPDGSFRPGQCVNRVEAMKIAVLEFYDGLVPDDTHGLLKPVDIDENAWYYPYFEYLYATAQLGTEHLYIIPDSDAAYYVPQASMTRAEVAEMLYRMKTVKDNGLEIYTDTYYPTPLGNDPVTEVSKKDRIVSHISDAFGEGNELEEIASAEFDLPEDIDESQLNIFFRIGDVYLALTVEPSINIYLENFPNGMQAQFKGVLAAVDGDSEWTKFLTITDTGTAKNNPYYMWNVGDTIMVSIVDDTGAGSGEGSMKIAEFADYGNSFISGDICYYYSAPGIDGYYSDATLANEFDDISDMTDCLNFELN